MPIAPHQAAFPYRTSPILRGLLLIAALMGGPGTWAQPLEANPGSSASLSTSPGPVRLTQTPAKPTGDDAAVPVAPEVALYVPGEFERFVQTQVGREPEIRRLGAELLSGSLDARSAELSPLVPPEYVVAPGDELLLNLWGSVEADLRLLVDRAGRITIPRVGAVQVAGIQHKDLADTVSRRVATVFKNFQISVSLGQLRGIRIFVSGFAQRPGAHTVSSLSTVLGALIKAGGPSAAGSFRAIELRRHGRLVATFDLYDLLLRGDRSADQIIQAGDVVHVGAVGTQIGVIGSVNKPAVLELKAGETVADALRFAGGLSAVADRSRLSVERLKDRYSARVAQLELPADAGQTLGQGDVLRAFSAVDVMLPTQRRNKRVRVEGEVMRPAEYLLPEGSNIEDALRMAGGTTPAAYIYATELSRESVRATQQENYDRALRDLETDATRLSASRRSVNANDGSAEPNRSLSRLIERLRLLKPSGRIVLQLKPDEQNLPNLALEDGDRIYIPPRPTTVGVFGSVFNPSSYIYQPERKLQEYLRLAGGPTKGADRTSIFVIRANGHVVSQRQEKNGFFSSPQMIDQEVALPGDTIFIPEELDKVTFLQNAKDWTQVFYQFGIGLAGIMSALK